MSSGQDIRSAETTYTGFIGMMKWGTIAAIAVATLVVLLIAK